MLDRAQRLETHTRINDRSTRRLNSATMFHPAILLTFACLCAVLIPTTAFASASAATDKPADLLRPPPLGGSVRHTSVAYDPPFYQRIAHWFGFGGAAGGSSGIPATEQLQRRAGYAEPSAANSLQSSAPVPQARKAPCNPCNKVPWTPMIQSRQRQFNTAPGATGAGAAGGAVVDPSGSQSSASASLSSYPLYSNYRSPPNAEPHTVYGPPLPPPLKLIDAPVPVNYGLPARTGAQTFNPGQQQQQQQLQLPLQPANKEDFAGQAAASRQPQSANFVSPYQPYSYQQHYQQFYTQRNHQHYHHPAQSPMFISLPTYAPVAALASAPLRQSVVDSRTRLGVPIPVPNLSRTPLPPLFNAKPFLANVYGYPSYVQQRPQLVARTPSSSVVSPSSVATSAPSSPSHPSSTSGTTVTQQPATNGQFSRPQHEPISPALDPEIEIVRSVPLAEFTSSVLYPIEVHQSPVLEVQPLQPAAQAAPADNHPAAATNVLNATSGGNHNSLDGVEEQQQQLQHHFDRDGSIQSIQTQLTSEYSARPITIHPDLYDDWSPMRLAVTTTTTTTARTPSTTTTSPSTTPVEQYQRIVPGEQIGFAPAPRDRETPIALLDSPIFYLNKGQQGQRASVGPSFAESTTVTVWQQAPSSPAPPRAEKRPKQIIIPYTSKNNPSPFQHSVQQQQQQQPLPQKLQQQTFDSAAGWSVQTHHSDQHDSQESKVVTATAAPATADNTTAAATYVTPYRPSPSSFTTSSTIRSSSDPSTSTTSKSISTSLVDISTARPQTTSKYLTKIRAAQLRELLRQEKRRHLGPDIARLQKNIDVWTEQEFGEEGAAKKASTISLRAHSKNIPSEYLTTTGLLGWTSAIVPQTTTMTPASASTSSSGATKQRVSTTERLPTTPQLDATTAEDNGVLADEAAFAHDPIVQNSIAEADLWQSLKLAISPGTREKVYVVTPQPWHGDDLMAMDDSNRLQLTVPDYQHQQHRPQVARHPGNYAASDLVRSAGRPFFKSPRFAMRPTPGSARGSDRTLRTMILPETVNKLQSSESTDSHSIDFRASTPLEPHLNAVEFSAKAFEMVTPPSSLSKTQKSSAANTKYNLN